LPLTWHPRPGPASCTRCAPKTALIIDFSAVSYFDSAGFALIDLLLSRARLAVVIAPGSVLRTAAQLMKIPFHDTVDDARAALRPA
jgi:ABC-type transporter Mla MlaB component